MVRPDSEARGSWRLGKPLAQQVAFVFEPGKAGRLKEIAMTKAEFDFDTWFGVLQSNVLDKAGVDFKDEDSVRDDYNNGRGVYDVIDEIAAEYE